MQEKIKKIFAPKLKLVKGTRFISFCFIGASVMIAAGILLAANMYYNIDTGEIVMEEIQRVTGVLRATAGAIVGGSATQNPDAGYAFEVVGATKLATTTIATGTLELIAANQQLRFTGGVSGYYVGFKANTSATSGQSIIYTLPAAPPDATNYVLTSNPSGVWQWSSVSGVGAGDVTAVGDCTGGSCFTGGTDGGNQLVFEGATADDYEITLTAADATADYTITLPAANGYVVLGTSTANYVAYWTGTHTLAGTSTLPASMGGTGANTSAWSGMLKVVNGAWGTATGTANYAAYWVDANTVAAEQYLAMSRGGTGTGLTATAGGIVYSGASALAISSAGNSNQILTSGGSGAPSWTNIADLITATNGLTESGTTALTLKLGGTLTETTTIAQGNYDMIFQLSGTGDFRITDSAGTTNILMVSNDGKIYFKDYPLAESGKQVLREMIPVFGFDLPSQTATTSFVQISKTIQNYPFSATSSGAVRVHKFVIRAAANTTTATTTWQVWNETGSTVVDTFNLALTQSTDIEKGEVYISNNVVIPVNTDDWRLEMKTNGNTVRVYQIFLAAYDQIQ